MFSMQINILRNDLLIRYSNLNIMERSEILGLLEIVNQQVSSAILGGRDEDYEELESLGLIIIHREAVQWTASITPAGIAYLGDD